MTEGFLWGGINIRKFCRILIRNIWMILAIMIISYLGLGIVDKHTHTPSYTSTAVVAVYPMSSPYRYHTIETVSHLSSKTEDVSSILNSAMFQSGLQKQDPSLQECIIDSLQITNTDLLVIHATSMNPGNALKGIQTAFDYYSRFSKDMTGAPEIKIILGPEEPYLVDNSSKIHRYRLHLCVLSGLMMAGLLLFIYVGKKTYKTEHSIRKHYKNVRFYSLPFIKCESNDKKGVLSKKIDQEPIKKLALEIKQVLYKLNKKTLLVTSCADKAVGTEVLSELARKLAEQDEKVILIGMESPKNDSDSVHDASDDTGKTTLLNVLQQKCTVKDAMLYRESLKVQCIQGGLDSIDKDVSYTIDDVQRVLSDCLNYVDIILINGAWCLSHNAEIWHEAVDASIALCRQEDADFHKVDNMLSDLQKGDTYFAGCILFGF